MNERSIFLPRAARPPRRSRRLLGAVDSPGDALACLGPNWFASVMGTGIVAVAATLLPERFAGQHQLAMAAWLLAAALLAVLLAATAVHWICYPQTARRHALDPGGASPFPVGTVATGVSELALHTGSHALAWLGGALLAMLLCAWLTALVNTARGAATGRLLLAPGLPGGQM
jgi:tellurite resistance protein TehA-like permease